jgi:hypothetical protein
MGPSVDQRQARLQKDLEERTVAFFEPKLRGLKLGIDQIQKQTVAELEESLAKINDAIQHSEQFGTFRVKMTTDAGVIIARSAAESQIDIGILPILLERKSIILDRIKLLTPADQLAHLKSEILKTIKDEQVRESVFRVLDAQEEKQQDITSRLERETKDVDAALQAERQSTTQAVAIAKLETRFEALDKATKTREDATEKAIAKIEDKAVSKWDVVTILFMSLAALGGLVGAVLGIVKWISGG